MAQAPNLDQAEIASYDGIEVQDILAGTKARSPTFFALARISFYRGTKFLGTILYSDSALKTAAEKPKKPHEKLLAAAIKSTEIKEVYFKQISLIPQKSAPAPQAF